MYDYLMTDEEKAELEKMTISELMREDVKVRKQKPFEDDFLQEAMEMTMAKMQGKQVDMYEG